MLTEKGQLRAMAEQMIPPLRSSYRKGQLGRIAVVGGSSDYTGAPFFSAITSARLGSDMSHVICDRDAGTVIKTYSPNLMVHPYLRSAGGGGGGGGDPEAEADPLPDILKQTLPILDRLHVLVVGPGLGRDRLMHRAVAEILKKARKSDLPAVIDADALMIVEEQPELVRGWTPGQFRVSGAVLTPNIVEFARVARAANVNLPHWPPTVQGPEREELLKSKAKEVANALGVVVILKGRIDYLSDGKEVLEVDRPGSLKRSGGQGDVLTGSIGTFLGYRKAYHDRLWERQVGQAHDLTAAETLLLAGWMGCQVTRESSQLAFERKGRSMQAEDVSKEAFEAFGNVFSFDENKSEARI